MRFPCFEQLAKRSCQKMQKHYIIGMCLLIDSSYREKRSSCLEFPGLSFVFCYQIKRLPVVIFHNSAALQQLFEMLSGVQRYIFPPERVNIAPDRVFFVHFSAVSIRKTAISQIDQGSGLYLKALSIKFTCLSK